MMVKQLLDLSAVGLGRVVVLSTLGTLCCIAVAFGVDSYSFETGTRRWGSQPLNNVIIPLLLAPPFFGYLLCKQRELAMAHRELMVVASTDPLTSCLNRRAFTAMVDRYLDRIATQEGGHAGALLVIDVDHFKTINDQFGHVCGDEALKAIAQAIRQALREFDISEAERPQPGGDRPSCFAGIPNRASQHSLSATRCDWLPKWAAND